MTGLLTACDALPLGRISVFVLVIQQDTNEAAMSVVNGHPQDDFDLSFKVFHELMKRSLKIILIIWKGWKAERPFHDRISFMLGSYNAGKRNIIKAQKIAQEKGLNPNLWASIEPALPGVTGRRSKETIGYVKKIHMIKGVLK